MSSLLWFVLVVVLILWLLGFFVVHLPGLIHLLLILALVILIYNLATSRRTL